MHAYPKSATSSACVGSRSNFIVSNEKPNVDGEDKEAIRARLSMRTMRAFVLDEDDEFKRDKTADHIIVTRSRRPTTFDRRGPRGASSIRIPSVGDDDSTRSIGKFENSAPSTYTCESYTTGWNTNGIDALIRRESTTLMSGVVSTLK